MTKSNNTPDVAQSALDGYDLAVEFKNIAQDLINLIKALTNHLETGTQDSLLALGAEWDNLPEPVCKEIERLAQLYDLNCV